MASSFMSFCPAIESLSSFNGVINMDAYIHIIRIGAIAVTVVVAWVTAIVMMMQVIAISVADGEIVMVINRITPSDIVTQIRTVVRWAVVKV